MKKKIDNNTNEENSKNAKKIIRRNLRLEARVTEKEYFQATELAKTCGLSISDYIRRTALGQHPRQRLSEREIEALCSLADARGDLIRIAAAVKSIQADKRAMYFSDTRFVEQWMIAATQLINRWNQIENYLTNNLLTHYDSKGLYHITWSECHKIFRQQRESGYSKSQSSSR